MRDDEKIVVQEGQEVVRRTVVGGRAPQRADKKRAVSVGIEKILVLAGRDAEFRTALVDDRDRALASRGIRLSPTEGAILRNLPTERLLAMADGIDLERHGKRRFLQSVAAVALAATTAAASVGCDESTFNAAGGARPDWMGEPTDASAIVEVRDDASYVETTDRVDVSAGVDIGIPQDTRDTVIVGQDVSAELGIRPDATDAVSDDVEPPEDAPQVGGIRPDVPDGEEW